MDFGALNNRITYLLKNRVVDWVRQDHPTHITIQFQGGPKMYIGLPESGPKELDISIVAGDEVDQEWVDRAESSKAPPAP